MSRITSCLERLSQSQRKALVPYIVAGDPSADFTVPMMHKLVEYGADIIELGVPFSDPMAEGPVIQLGHERALANKTGLRDVLAMVSEFRQQDQTTPVVLMGYANPIEYMGYESFTVAADEAGIDGLLTVDLPPEEAVELDQQLKTVGIDTIYLISPTTTDERAKLIAEAASGYLYYVSVKGVTGSGALDTEAVSSRMSEIRNMTDVPVCVGFGIKDAETAKTISGIADGVVVGSALVKLAFEQAQTGAALSQQIEQSSKLIGDMRQAMDA